MRTDNHGVAKGEDGYLNGTAGLPLGLYCIALVAVLICLAGGVVFAGEKISLNTETGMLHGSLEMPTGKDAYPVALILSGSGPTDRDGNIPFAGKNNSLRYLAEGLASRGIGSLRFDKRGVAASAKAVIGEEDLRFDTLIDDAVLWCGHLRENPRSGPLLIIGHSEGSLIGMVASQRAKVHGFVSIAGTGYSASKLLLKQMKPKLPGPLYKEAETIVEKLVAGETCHPVPTELHFLFRPSVQPYLISWFRYDPVKELSQIKVPVLILQGTTDMQVGVDDAKRLAEANKGAEAAIIEGMNHVLKKVPDDLQQQINSYGDPSLPVMPEVVGRIAFFAKRLGSRVAEMSSDHQIEYGSAKPQAAGRSGIKPDPTKTVE
jgi:pimeloyl-ACP methyl ester carboxylesterase